MVPAATWVRPPKRARLHRIRRALQVATSLVFILAPFVDLFRFDLGRGQLVLGGAKLGLGDLHAVYALTILFVVVVFGGALLYGRVYCGWMCPQTTLSEWVASIERWACKKVKLKGACKAISVGVTFIISAFVAASLVSYFVAPEARLAPPRLAWISWGITTAVLAGFLGLRHRFCLLVCPYGILQNVIQDRATLGVVFDQSRKAECTNCLLCVRACFMGLDIRETNFDARCLNCGDCIAATRIAKRCPEQPLIRFQYGTEPSTWPGWLKKAGISEPRRVVVLLVSLALAGVFAAQLAGREPLEIDIAAQFDRAAFDGDLVRNAYRLTVRNRLDHPIHVSLAFEGLDAVALEAPAGGADVAASSQAIVDVSLTAGACRLPEGVNDLRVRVLPDAGAPVSLPTFFFVPSRRTPCAGSSVSPSPGSSASSASPSSPASAPTPRSST